MDNQITRQAAIRGWNDAGTEVNADLLSRVFKVIESQYDAEVHNFIMLEIIAKRIGGSEGRFLRSVAELVEQYSMEHLNGPQKETASRIEST